MPVVCNYQETTKTMGAVDDLPRSIQTKYRPVKKKTVLRKLTATD
uniref:Uncharacterized protein n=1 Tax=Anopheles atroparvus TaxID=41427 RepID=A0AAG5DMS1_ANOAO